MVKALEINYRPMSNTPKSFKDANTIYFNKKYYYKSEILKSRKASMLKINKLKSKLFSNLKKHGISRIEVGNDILNKTTQICIKNNLPKKDIREIEQILNNLTDLYNELHYYNSILKQK